MNWPDDFINKVICGDCNKILPLIPDGAVDAVITDPPYGISLDTANKSRGRGVGGLTSKAMALANDYPKVYGDDKPFEPMKLVRRYFDKPMFLFGANFYHRQLPQSGAWVIWDKTGGGRVMNDNADCELVWSNLDFAPRICHHLWNGLMKDSERQDRRVHPTQKPVALMSWIINKWTKPDDLILDCYAGSGSTLVAAKQLNRRYIGIEISGDYCEIARQRLAQQELFNRVAV